MNFVWKEKGEDGVAIMHRAAEGGNGKYLHTYGTPSEEILHSSDLNIYMTYYYFILLNSVNSFGLYRGVWILDLAMNTNITTHSAVQYNIACM